MEEAETTMVKWRWLNHHMGKYDLAAKVYVQLSYITSWYTLILDKL